jgi:hypothetical protein
MKMEYNTIICTSHRILWVMKSRIRITGSAAHVVKIRNAYKILDRKLRDTKTALKRRRCR